MAHAYYQRVEAFPLVSAERYDVSLHGRLFRDHDASPDYRRYQFRDRPQDQRRRALVLQSIRILHINVDCT